MTAAAHPTAADALLLEELNGQRVGPRPVARVAAEAGRGVLETSSQGCVDGEIPPRISNADGKETTSGAVTADAACLDKLATLMLGALVQRLALSPIAHELVGLVSALRNPIATEGVRHHLLVGADKSVAEASASDVVACNSLSAEGE